MFPTFPTKNTKTKNTVLILSIDPNSFCRRLQIMTRYGLKEFVFNFRDFSVSQFVFVILFRKSLPTPDSKQKRHQKSINQSIKGFLCIGMRFGEKLCDVAYLMTIVQFMTCAIRSLTAKFIGEHRNRKKHLDEKWCNNSRNQFENETFTTTRTSENR